MSKPATLADLPSYRPHNQCQAGRILAVTGRHVTVEVPDTQEEALVEVPPSLFDRHFPDPGEWLVVYPGGHMAVMDERHFLDTFGRVSPVSAR